MKWLFAVLVALNIIVFGSMVAYRTQHKTTKPESALEGGTHELLRPSSLDAPKAEPQQASQPDWVADESDGLIMAEPESEEAEALRKKQEAQQLKEKKEKMRREKEAQERRAAEEEMGAAGVERLCTSSATVVMDEDDYHRIKGLLGKWPHAASRSIEKRNGASSGETSSKTFRVVLPADGDTSAQLDALGSRGFSGSIHNGEISVDVTRSRSSAQVLISRLSSAGFGGARIVEQEDRSAPDTGLSVARMTVVFMAVDERDAQDIRNIVGRYGKLNMKTCR